MKEDKELVEILNHAIEAEYGALFLMPQHIARLQDSELAASLRRACQEELEHAETTARLILSLGGLPKGDFKRLKPMAKAQDMLRSHIEGEQQVILLYRQAMAKARRPEHRNIIRKLLADEEKHQAIFDRLLKRLERAGEKTV
jgi:bacterioferritin (cytochrome b1)